MAPCSSAGIDKLKRYAMKDDSATSKRIAGPWAEKPIYRGQDLPIQLWAWQQQVKDIVLQAADSRVIHWLYDNDGNSGKSMFAKYMMYHHDMLTLTYGNAKDLTNLVFTNADKPAYFFDLTRAKPREFGTTDLYSTMESIKNGYIVNQKYATGVLMMMPPHIVVFSNQEPEYALLSQDRWKVWKFSDGPKQLRRLIPINAGQLAPIFTTEVQNLEHRIDNDPSMTEDDWSGMLECYEELAAARRQAETAEANYQSELALIGDERLDIDLPEEAELVEQLSQHSIAPCELVDMEAALDA